MKRTLPVLVSIAIVSALPGPAAARPKTALFGPVAADDFRSLDAQRAAARPRKRAVKVTKARIGPDGLAVPPPSAPPQGGQDHRRRQRDRHQAVRVRRRPRHLGRLRLRLLRLGELRAARSRACFDVAARLERPGRLRQAGPGRWVTVMGNPGHAYMVVAGLRFDTSSGKQTGNRWTAEEGTTSGYAVRHPPGLVGEGDDASPPRLGDARLRPRVSGRRGMPRGVPDVDGSHV